MNLELMSQETYLADERHEGVDIWELFSQAQRSNNYFFFFLNLSLPLNHTRAVSFDIWRGMLMALFN